jgi:hypothetical protein
VIRRNDHLTGNALLGAGAVHHIIFGLFWNVAFASPLTTKQRTFLNPKLRANIGAHQ